MKPGFRAALGAILLLGAGCASSDLSQKTDTRASVVECLPVGTPDPAVISRAIWYPHSNGYGSTDASPLGHATGVLAFAGDKLWFMAWNGEERHFDMLQSVPVATAAQLSVTRGMLVVQSRNLSFDAFELIRQGAYQSDPAAAGSLLRQLQEYRARHPQKDDWKAFGN